MNGNRPVFLDGVQLDKSYYQTPDPYTYSPDFSVNLLELSRYAKKAGKSLVELTAEEVEMFRSK